MLIMCAFGVFQVTSAGVRPLLPAEPDKFDNHYGSDETDSDSPDTVASNSSHTESESCFVTSLYINYCCFANGTFIKKCTKSAAHMRRFSV